MRNAAETVLQAFAELHHVGFALHVVEFLVEAYSFALLRHIGGRQHQFEVGVNHAVRHVGGVVVLQLVVERFAVAEGVGKLLGGEFEHSLFEHFLIGFVS